MGLLLVACFSVEKVDVTGHSRLLVDDFEDHDDQPSTTALGSWSCFAFTSDQTLPVCGLTRPGFKSNFAYSMTFDLQSAPPLTTDGVGAGIGTGPSVGASTVDFSSHESLHFNTKRVLSSPEPPHGMAFAVNFGCKSVDHQTGSVKYGFMVEDSFYPNADWQFVTLALADFEQPTWQGVSMRDPSDCPRLVDGFSIQVKLLDTSESASGTLTIDNVYFE